MVGGGLRSQLDRDLVRFRGLLCGATAGNHPASQRCRENERDGRERSQGRFSGSRVRNGQESDESNQPNE